MTAPSIFISYRVKDTQIEARLLYVELANHFGKNAVFLDKKRLQPGDAWPKELETNVCNCRILLILVKDGVTWAGHNKRSGVYRINDPKDWVRLEIEKSKEENKEIIPVFFDVGEFPHESVLPGSLNFLDNLHAKMIETEKNWDDGVAALIRCLEEKGIQPQKTAGEIPVTLLDDYPLPEGINPYEKYKEPYIGMRYFDYDAAPLFFGRTRELNTFFSLIERPETRLILVHGHSGVGKSSFLAAGVLPRIQQKCGKDNIHYERRDKTIQLGNQLQQLLKKTPQTDKKRIFILDQVEEMFTDPVAGERDEWVNQLKEALEENPADQFVLGFRSDYLTDVQSLLARIRVARETIHLEPLDHAAIVEAIEGVKKSEEKSKIYQYYLNFDGDFAKKVAADLAAKETAQVSTILQSRLQKLYIAARDKKAPDKMEVQLLWEDYEKLSNDARAETELLDHAVEKVKEKCSDADLKTILETLDQFVINKETAGAKPKSEIDGNAQSPLYQSLLRENLLTEMRTKNAIRLAHDVLAPVVRRRYQELLSEENDRLTAQNFDLLWQNLQKEREKLDFEAARQALTQVAQLQFYPRAYDLAPVAFELAFVFLWAGKATEGKELLRIFLDIQKKRYGLFAPMPETSDLHELRDYLKICDPNQFRQLEETYFPTMISVQGGKFTMGSSELYDEQQLHEVKLSDFRIAKTPTTWWQFGIFCLQTGFKVPGDEGWGRGKRPVINVSWYDAVEYCNWLSEQHGLTPYYAIDKRRKDPNNKNSSDDLKWIVTPKAGGNGYRLPTEAEWEYAARGGSQSKGYKYAGSNNLDEVAWYWENSGDKRLSGEWDFNKIRANNCRMHPVGEKKPNELGLYDMSGNVWEWCWDWVDDYSSGAKTNPRGPEEGSNRVRRGGSWFLNPRFCRVAYRFNVTPAGRSNLVGFRLARS